MTEQPQLLALGTEKPVPIQIIDWLQQKTGNGQRLHTGMLNDIQLSGTEQMAILIAPHTSEQLRASVQYLSTQIPTLIIGPAEDRSHYPDACAWLDEQQLTPALITTAMESLESDRHERLIHFSSREQIFPKLAWRLIREEKLWMQLISCRWRTTHPANLSEPRIHAQRAFEKRLRANAPTDALLGKLLEDQFVVISRHQQQLSRHWISAPDEAVPTQWDVFFSNPMQITADDRPEDVLESCVREMEHQRMLQSGLGSRALSSSESEVVNDIGRALRKREFYLEFQPQFDTRSGRLEGAEALLRWLHPEIGIISPAQFIHDAEMAGLMRALGRWVLIETLNAWHHLNDEGVTLRMSVNVAFPEVADPDYARKVLSLLEEYRVPTSCIELELTETAMMLDTSVCLENLRTLKQAGVQIVLDDFGTGFSSLSHLSDLPVTGIKLDRSFVTPLGEHEPDSPQMHIVASLIDLAKRLGICTTAEGVEDQACLEQVVRLGCDRIQGFLFARPMPVERLIRLAAAPDTVLDDYSGQQCLF